MGCRSLISQRNPSKAALRCAAFKWFSLAADKGDARAQYNLGHCYEHGTGTKPNVLEAAVLYRKAAEKGNAKAYFRSGWLEQAACSVARRARCDCATTRNAVGCAIVTVRLAALCRGVMCVQRTIEDRVRSNLPRLARRDVPRRRRHACRLGADGPMLPESGRAGEYSTPFVYYTTCVRPVALLSHTACCMLSGAWRALRVACCACIVDR